MAADTLSGFKEEEYPRIMGQKEVGLHQPLLLLALFCVGVLCLRFLPVLVPPQAAVIALVAALLTLWRSTRWRWLAALTVGLAWACLIAALTLQKELPVQFQQQELVAEGVVEGLVQMTDRGARFNFRVHSLSAPGTTLASPGLVRLSSYDQSFKPLPGERWRLMLKLKRPHGITNPGVGFHQETWMFHQRLRARGYVRDGSAERLSDNAGSDTDLSGRVNRLRSSFNDFVQQTMSGPTASGILSALTVGIRGDLEQRVWQVLQDTGTIHLVAISGLHIGMVAMLIGWLAGLLGRQIPGIASYVNVQTVAVVSGVIAGFSYAMLAGFTLPTRRALAMLMVVALAMLIRRRPRPWSTLTGVLALVLLLDPLAPFSTSLWLSFGAVASLMLIMTSNARRTEAVNDDRRFTGWCSRASTVIGKWSTMQLYLLVGMLPILLIGFQKASLVAPLANLIAIPVIGLVVVPLGLAALALWWLGLDAVPSWLLDAAGILLNLIWKYLEWLADFSWAVWYQGNPSLAAAVAASVGAILVLGGRRLPGRWLGTLWMLPMLMPSSVSPTTGAFTLLQLDVGQGLASIVQTRHHALLFDAGAAYSGGFNLGSAAVVPALRNLGIDQLDRFVISHGDNDHIGGATEVANVFLPRSVVTSATESPYLPDNAGVCRSGQQWTWDGVHFEVLWPSGSRAWQGNNASCVLRIVGDGGSLLLTGDIEDQAERALVRSYGNSLRSDVLVVPHHGSKTSSTARFLARVSPRLGLISAGYLNRFGHPARSVVDRYRGRDIPLLNTASEGAITVTFDTGGIRVSGQRRADEVFWRTRSTTDYESLNRMLDEAAPMVQSRP